MTNRELLASTEAVLSGLDRQRRFVLVTERRPMPCPACKTPINAFDAAGIDIDAYDFGVTTHPYRCPACGAELDQVVPFISLAGNSWHWQINHAWLQEQMRKAMALDQQSKVNDGACPSKFRSTPTPKQEDRIVSHIVSIKTKVNDPDAVAAACRRLNLAAPSQGTAQLFSGAATGLIVQLPGWQYPAVIEVQTGTVHFDNFEGNWGDPVQLDRFLQMYSVEKTKLEGRRKGYQVNEQVLQDGSIKLQIVEGG